MKYQCYIGEIQLLKRLRTPRKLATTVHPCTVIDSSHDEAGNEEPMEIDEYVTETEDIP